MLLGLIAISGAKMEFEGGPDELGDEGDTEFNAEMLNLGPNRVVDEQTGRFRRVRAGEVGRTQIATKEKGMHSPQETKVTAQKSQAGTATISASMLSKLYATGGPINSWIYQRKNASNQDAIDLCLNTTNDEDPCTSNVVMHDGAAEMVVKLATNKWIEGCTSGWQTEDFKIVSQDGVCSTVRQYGTGSGIAKLYNPSAEPMKSLISKSSLTTVWFVPTATFIKVTDREFNVTAQSKNGATSIHQGKFSYTKLTHCVALVYQLWNHSKVVEHPYAGETFKGVCGDTTWSHLNQTQQTETIKHCTYQKRMVSDCAADKSLEVTACRAHKKHNKQDWTPIEQCQVWLQDMLTSTAPQLV